MEVEQADVLKWAAWYSGPKFHALLTDPPYHLTSIVERFGKPGSAPVKVDEFFDGNGNSKGASPYSRTSKGFMGKVWDGGDIAFQPSTWAALAEHLLPGAFGMAFASSRGWHRLAVAIEDAGLIIHPSIFGWVTGQGFPKATRIDTQIDKAAGAERENIPNPLAAKQTGAPGHGKTIATAGGDKKQNTHLSFPATPLAQAWASHRYGLQCLKPALEPIIVFQKPYEGRPVECITETGAGALNIQGGRIPGPGWTFTHTDKTSRSAGIMGNVSGARQGIDESDPSGRWPANFILDAAAAERLDELSGELSQCGGPKRTDSGDKSIFGIGQPGQVYFEDKRGASRFFFRYVADALDEADPVNQNTCAVCDRKHGIISETQAEGIPCEDANIAKKSSRRNGKSNGSAQTPVQPAERQSGGGKPDLSSSPVNNAEKSGHTTPAGIETIAAENVPPLPESKIVQSVKSAGNLCDLCATAIAQSLVQMQQGHAPELLHTLDYITERRNRILNLSLALSAESLENTDITRITQDQTILSGFVLRVIENYTANVKRDQRGLRFSDSVFEQLNKADPVRYNAKASRRERDAGLDELPIQMKYTKGHGNNEPDEVTQRFITQARNPHPTVKPIALARYLATLLLPPAEYAPRRILVPFAGAGSEMVGAMQAGWEEVTGIELEAEYAEIARARLEYWANQKPAQIEMVMK